MVWVYAKSTDYLIHSKLDVNRARTIDSSTWTRARARARADSLKETAEVYESAARDALGMLRSEYEPFIEKIVDYLDEDEIRFSELLKKNNEKHVNSLQRIIESQGM